MSIRKKLEMVRRLERFSFASLAVLCWLSVPGLSIPCLSQSADEALLTKARSIYDAPFTRNLVSFDCAVQFDWKQHTIDLLGAVPPEAAPTLERLQTIRHRVFVDRSGATMSAIPSAPDLSAVENGVELEQALNAMVSGGLNAWIPFSTNAVLPEGPANFNLAKSGSGYRLTMTGPDVAATLLLGDDMRLSSGISQQPQAMRFATDFSSGPNGFLLGSLKTGDTTDAAETRDASFSYTYQAVQSFQLPATVTIKPAAPGSWRYALTDCKVVAGVKIEAGLPKK